MEVLIDSLRGEWEALIRLAPRIAISLVVLLIFIAAGQALSRGLIRALERGRLTPTHQAFFRNLVPWIMGLLGLVVGLNILGLQTLAAGLVAGGGVSAVVLGFAFRQIGENLLAGLLLAFSRPFELGHVVRSGEFEGEVRGIELRYTHVRTVDGRDVFIPSSRIFNEPLVNFTRDGLRRFSYTVGVDYASDHAVAVRLLLESLQKDADVLGEPAPAVLVGQLLPAYVELRVAFWLDVLRPGIAVGSVLTRVMIAGTRTLRENGFVLSSEVSTNVAIDAKPLRVQVA